MLSRCLNCKFAALIGKASHIFKHVNWLPNRLKFLHVWSPLSVTCKLHACCTHFAFYCIFGIVCHHTHTHTHKAVAFVALPLAVDVMRLCQHIR